MDTLGTNFYSRLVNMTSELGMKPEDLLAIMVSESGINPKAGKGNSAAGLIQFMPSTLHDVGYKGSQDSFRQLSGEDQIPFIKRYIQEAMEKNGGPFTSAAQYYVANFWPVALKLPGIKQGNPNTIIVEANPPKIQGYSKKYLNLGYKIPAASEAAAYKSNPLFDKDKKGFITYGDMIKQVEVNKQNPMYQKALANMQNTTGYKAENQPGKNMMAKNTIPHQNSTNQLSDIINKYMKMLAASDKTFVPKMHKTSNNILIQIDASNNYGIEFSRVLSNALDDELLSKSYPYSDGKKVEIECNISGPIKECIAAIQEVVKHTTELFQSQLSKIDESSKIDAFYRLHKKSNYLPISPSILESNYNQLLLKFAQRK